MARMTRHARLPRYRLGVGTLRPDVHARIPWGCVAIVSGLSFSYVLHELPRGRFPFRRWRFELWHGARLEAAGWRTTERDAARALRNHASRVAHAMFGLRAPAADSGAG